MRMLTEGKKVILGRLEVFVKKGRIQIGLDNLMETNDPVAIMQNELVLIKEIKRTVDT